MAAAFGVAWIAFGTQPWELLPFRDERVLGPVLRDAANGIVDFYAVFLPFEPLPNPEMHSLVLCAVFGFVLATALLVAARRPLAAAGVTVAGIGWPATLLGGTGGRRRSARTRRGARDSARPACPSARTVLAGVAIAALVVVGAAGTSSATTLGADAALDWETWDIRGEQERQASDVRFVWDSNYEGISFPNEKTVVLRVEGPDHLELLANDDARPVRGRSLAAEPLLARAGRPRRPRRCSDRSSSRRAAERPELWLEQRVEVEALVDDHLAAAGTPVALDARRLGTVFVLSGGVLRAEKPIGQGESYRIWSYAPDPAPRTLARTPVRYPSAAARFLDVDGRIFPAFGSEGRERRWRDCSPIPRTRRSDGIERCTTSPGASPATRPRRTRRFSRSSRGSARRVASATTSRRRGRRACRHSSRSSPGTKAGLLPALRGRDGGDAPDARGTRTGRGRVHERRPGRTASGW